MKEGVNSEDINVNCTSDKKSGGNWWMNFRYQGEEKEKKYKTKRRKGNKYMEEIYLQRLVGSVEKKSRKLETKKL